MFGSFLLRLPGEFDSRKNKQNFSCEKQLCGIIQKKTDRKLHSGSQNHREKKGAAHHPSSGTKMSSYHILECYHGIKHKIKELYHFQYEMNSI